MDQRLGNRQEAIPGYGDDSWRWRVTRCLQPSVPTAERDLNKCHWRKCGSVFTCSCGRIAWLDAFGWRVIEMT